MFGVFIVLTILAATVCPYDIFRVCDQKTSTLECSSGQIVIHKAIYGKTSRNMCTKDDGWPLKCVTDVQIVKKECEGKSYCTLTSSPKKLHIEDPCVLIENKYLEVSYSCSGEVNTPQPKTTLTVPTTGSISAVSKQITVCEWDIGELSCQNNQQIKVTYAFWGRDDLHTCKGNWDEANTKNCSNQNILTTIASHCNTRQTCEVYAHITYLKDPCKDISKYLRIKYQCIAIPTTPKIFLTKNIVENVQSIITCLPGGKVIHILSATFGCESKQTDTSKVIRFDCENVGFCTISAGVGKYGDPCRGIKKSLQIKYICGPKDTSPQTTIVIPPVPTAGVLPASTIAPGKCGVSPVAQSRIVNGDIAKRGAWPWQVAIYSTKSTKEGFFICGGSLINPWWFVSAAHCFGNPPNAANYFVILGEYDRTKIEGSEKRYTLSSITIHAEYGKAVAHDKDIAVVKLQQPAIFNDYVWPVCLPIQGETTAPGSKCYVTGWGFPSYPDHASTVLRQAVFSTVSQAECKEKLKQAPPLLGDDITTSMICATDTINNSSACHGDSGGPFVCRSKEGRWVLKGAVSWGSTRCAITDMYQVFVNIPQFRTWIDEQVSKK